MRTLAVLMLFVVVSLAGCSGSDPTTSADTDPTTAPPSPGAGPATGEGAVAPGNGTAAANETMENLVPVLNVTVDATNGTAPLLVTFTVDVQDDSDNLTWAFFVAGNETLNGTAFPATFNHTFEAGSWNVTITAHDGEHTVEHMVAIDVEAGAVVPAGPQQIVDGSFTGLVSGCADQVVGTLAPTENIRFDLDLSTAGGTFTADFTSGSTAQRHFIVFYGSGGSGTGGVYGVAGRHIEGAIPAAATYARVGVCGGGASTVHYEGFVPA